MKRNEFMRRWSDPVLLHDALNFEGLGWDLVVFVLSNGVEGELTLGRRSNFMKTHGGAHKVLVDETGVLDGVEFPLYQPSQEQRVAAAERDLRLFWRELFKFTKVLARGNLWAAQTWLGLLRRRCKALSDQYGDAEAASLLDTTFVPLDRDAILEAAQAMIRFNLQVGLALVKQLGIEYPAALQEVALRRFEEVFGVEIVQAKD